MAEINIQRKKRSVWPWIIALLIVVALMVFLYFAFDAEPTDATSQLRNAPANTALHSGY